MQQAAVRSPFELNETDAQWIEWRRNRPLFSLKEKEQTESRFSENSVLEKLLAFEKSCMTVSSTAELPETIKGLPLTLIIAALISLAFGGFAGI